MFQFTRPRRARQVINNIIDFQWDAISFPRTHKNIIQLSKSNKW